MALFRILDRKNTMDSILSFAKQNKYNLGLVAVGSGSFGYTDELSDIDWVIVIDKEENLDLIQEYMASELRNTLPSYKHVPLQVFLCNLYPEIDIGYGVYTKATASRAHWKVLFYKPAPFKSDGAFLEIAKAKTNQNEYSEKLAECADHTWNNFMHYAVAIKHKQYWRTIAELAITAWLPLCTGYQTRPGARSTPGIRIAHS